MREGSWTIESCAYAEVKSPRGGARGQRDHRGRARQARVPRGRGGARVRGRRDRAARPLLARRHGRRGRANPSRDRRGEADLRARRLRRGRHLRDCARRPDAARARRRRRLAPAEPLRGGLRRLRRHDLSPRRRRLRTAAHRRLRDHGRGGGLGSEGARARGDRDRPPPPRRRAPGVSGGRDPAVRLSVSGALRHRRRLQARAGARRGRGAVPRPGRARDDCGRRAAARRESLARDRGPAGACPHATARPAGADAERPRRPRRRRRRRGRIPAGAPDQRRGPSRPARRRARAAPHD